MGEKGSALSLSPTTAGKPLQFVEVGANSSAMRSRDGQSKHCPDFWSTRSLLPTLDPKSHTRNRGHQSCKISTTGLDLCNTGYYHNRKIHHSLLSSSSSSPESTQLDLKVPELLQTLPCQFSCCLSEGIDFWSFHVTIFHNSTPIHPS